MMRRFVFMAALVIAIAGASPAVHAQQRGELPVVGFLLGSSERVHGVHVDALREALRDLGQIDGRDFVLERRFARGDPGLARAQAAEFAERNVAVIVTVGMPPTRAAAAATRTIPIVVAYGSDFLESGLVAEMARPGGNVTGMTVLTRELAAKRLEILTEAVPGLSRVAVLFNPDAAAVAAAGYTRSAGEKLGVSVREAHVRGPADFEEAFAAMARARAGAIIMVAGPVTAIHRRQLIALANARKLPTVCWRPAMARSGCLLSYGADRAQLVRRAATYVVKVLKGADPSSLPVESPDRFYLAVNLRTAKTLGLTIPRSILLRATEVIE